MLSNKSVNSVTDTIWLFYPQCDRESHWQLGPCEHTRGPVVSEAGGPPVVWIRADYNSHQQKTPLCFPPCTFCAICSSDKVTLPARVAPFMLPTNWETDYRLSDWNTYFHY